MYQVPFNAGALATCPATHYARATTVTGPAAMPSPRSDHAPSFSGEGSESLEDFLHEYEELAYGHGLTERQAVDWVIKYVHSSQRDLWKSLDGFVASNWNALCNELRGMYLETPLERKYSKRKLSDFVIRTSKVRISEEKDVLDYFRQFNLLSKLLFDSNRLDVEGRNKYFWLGFHTEDREALKERLFAKFPDHPPGSYFDYKEVLRMARIIFAYHDDEPGFGAPQASTRRCDTPPPPKSHKRDTWETDRSHHPSRRNQPREVPYYEYAEQNEDSDSKASDNSKEESEALCHLAQKVETKTICFKNCPPKSKDQEIEELIG
jgi:hypothetical protein